MGIVLPIPRAPARVAGYARQARNNKIQGEPMSNTEQQFLKELDDKLWKAADKLRSNLDAANYKHVVLGLIFLKYVSDAFEE
ncbi:MAG: type I restriction-modification system subunit M N-terminal domain-containing protein, partial [Haliea sp.]